MTTTTNTRVNPVQLLTILKKHGFETVSDNEVSSKKMSVSYNKTFITVKNLLTATQVKIRITKATLKSVSDVVVAMDKGKDVKHKDVITVAPATQPKPKEEKTMSKDELNVDDLTEGIDENWESPAEKKAKEDAEKKGAKNKAASSKTKEDKKAKEPEKKKLVKPSNAFFTNQEGEEVTVDTEVVFDELSGQFNKDRELREEIEQGWTALAEKYNYSVIPIIRALFVKGLWPERKDKDGNPVENKDFPGEIAPAGYQAVYKAEREEGKESIGHMVNIAAAAFGRAKRKAGLTAAGQQDIEDAKNPAKKGATPSKSTKSEMAVDEILEQMNALSRKLPKEDLISWLESDPLVSELIDGIVDTRFQKLLGEEKAA